MHPIMSLRSLPVQEKAVVGALLRLRRAASQAELARSMADPPSQPTLSRAMAQLMGKGLVLKTGTTRNARFELSLAATRFATRPDLRPEAPYDPARIAGYESDVSTWLPAAARGRMAAAAARVEHRLDASTYSRGIAERFLIDLAWASSHLEGNTYDQLSTEALIRYGQAASGHDLAEATMILNHKAAIGRLLERQEAASGSGVPDAAEAFRVHALLMNGLMDFGDLGRIRRGAVRVSSTSYRPADDPVRLGLDLADLLAKARSTRDPFEASFLLAAGLPYLQAFGDGNKRMGRLLCSVPLLAAGLPPLSFLGVDQTAYISGLIVFYETGEAELLGEALAAGYEVSAPSYQAAVAGPRRPRPVELAERPRLAGAVREIVRQGVHGREALGAAALASLAGLPAESREDAARVVVAMIEGLSPESAVLYDLEDAEVDRYLAQTAATDGA